MDSLPINYRPYQSKRHSRSHSSSHSFTSASPASSLRATSPLPQAPLTNTQGQNTDPIPLSPPLAPERSFTPVFLDEEDEKRLGMPLPLPATNGNGIGAAIALRMDEKGKAIDLSPPFPPAPSSHSQSQSSSPSPPPSIHQAIPSSTSTTLPTSSTPALTPERDRPSIPSRPSSTFRHVPLRPANAHPRGAHAPSPLRPHAPVVTRSFQAAPPTTRPPRGQSLVAGQGRTEPNRATSQPVVQQLGRPAPAPSPAPSAPVPVQAPPPPAKDPQLLTVGRANTGSALLSPPSSSAPTPGMLPSPGRALSPAPSPATSAFASPALSPAFNPNPPIFSSVTMPTGPQAASASTSAPPPGPVPAPTHNRQTPYRAGFQPRPLYRIRTEAFLEVRNRLSDERKGEDRRLERRLEKLIQLHFAPKSASTADNLPPQLSRSTSLLNELKGAAAQEAAEIRAAEQKIAPWEPDSSVSACRLCSTPFNGFTVRKHHCRLCGTIVCSQPPAPKHSNPARREACSLLIGADWRTGRVWDIKEGIAYGVQRRDSSAGSGAGGAKGPGGKGPGAVKEEEKGVRVCRECREKVKRIQYVLEKSRVPPISRFYDALMLLEKEMLDLLPTYQDQLLEIPSPPSAPSLAPAQETRKLLLDTFSDYDKIAGKILNLPCVKGSEEERVQRAIWMRSRAVLQREMGGLPALPKLPAHKKTKSRASLPGSGPGSGAGSGYDTPLSDPDTELAHRLQPLLEQEALLDQYVQEATAARKFEDARALRQSLEEIREEVGRLVREAGG